MGKPVRALLRLALFAGILGGAASAQAETTVPMRDCSGLPCVSVTVGSGAPLTLLIDTGNVTSVLDAAAAKRLGLVVKPVVDASGKPIPGYSQATVPSLALGGETLSEFAVLVADMQPEIDKGALPRSDGTLAYVALENRVLTLDYHRRLVELSDPGANVACPGKCGAIANPTFGKNGPAIVTTTGFQVNGRDVAVQVDTLYTGTMLIYPTSVAKLGLTQDATATKTRSFPYTDGGVDMVEGIAKTLGFSGDTLMADAPLYFATPKVHTPDGLFDGTVGAGLFANRVVTLDFHANRFWID